MLVIAAALAGCNAILGLDEVTTRPDSTPPPPSSANEDGDDFLDADDHCPHRDTIDNVDADDDGLGDACEIPFDEWDTTPAQVVLLREMFYEAPKGLPVRVTYDADSSSLRFAGQSSEWVLDDPAIANHVGVIATWRGRLNNATISIKSYTSRSEESSVADCQMQQKPINPPLDYGVAVHNTLPHFGDSQEQNYFADYVSVMHLFIGGNAICFGPTPGADVINDVPSATNIEPFTDRGAIVISVSGLGTNEELELTSLIVYGNAE